MTGKPENPNAFPHPALADENFHPSYDMSGMTLRDYFAGQALAAIVAKSPFQETPKSYSVYDKAAIGAYDYADAMLKERAE